MKFISGNFVGTSHPTIKNPEQEMSVLAQFASDFQAPVAVEGFDRMIYLCSSEQAHPEYSQSQVTTVLQSIRDSPSLSHTRSHFRGTSRPSRSRPRGYNRGRGRGRGHGRGYFNSDYNQENESHGEPERSAHLKRGREQTSTFSTKTQAYSWLTAVQGRRSIVADLGIRNRDSVIAPSIIYTLASVAPRSDGGFDAQSID